MGQTFFGGLLGHACVRSVLSPASSSRNPYWQNQMLIQDVKAQHRHLAAEFCATQGHAITSGQSKTAVES